MQTLTLEAAERAHKLAFYGGASVDAQNAALTDLRAAVERTESLDVKRARLLSEAASLDDREAYHMEQEASLAGRIARCLEVGNDELAAVLKIQQHASVRCAEKASAEAEAKRAEAAAIKRRTDFADAALSIMAAE